MTNFFATLPRADDAEQFLPLALHAGVRVERIVSRGQVTPPGEWYDQAGAEWVMVVEGAAELIFEGPDERRRLTRGDFVFIPAHRRHRVAWTDPDQPTLWLAVHWPAES